MPRRTTTIQTPEGEVSFWFDDDLFDILSQETGNVISSVTANASPQLYETILNCHEDTGEGAPGDPEPAGDVEDDFVVLDEAEGVFLDDENCGNSCEDFVVLDDAEEFPDDENCRNPRDDLMERLVEQGRQATLLLEEVSSLRDRISRPFQNPFGVDRSDSELFSELLEMHFEGTE